MTGGDIIGTMNIQQAHAPTFAELFTPKLVTVFREGYRLEHLRADAIAGLTVAIVALPLSMAIAIASGVSPERGLYTAIVGGFLVSLLGGSRFQIGGPAGAFIVLVAATVARHGIDGLILATFLSGMILAAAGYLRLGTYIKFIPYPVTVGFTAAIARDHLRQPAARSLRPDARRSRARPPVRETSGAVERLAHHEPVGRRHCRAHHCDHPGPARVASGLAGHADRRGGRIRAGCGAQRCRWKPSARASAAFRARCPCPALPDFSPAKIMAVLPDALSFALLGAIESLLSAVVADGMSGRRHRSNCELVAQGFANMGSALFGGFCVTGTIARTATNVRAHAHGPVSGMLHSVFILRLHAGCRSARLLYSARLPCRRAGRSSPGT